MTTEPSGEQCQTADGHCITCGDEGIPMRVVGAGGDAVAVCRDDDGELHEVAIDLVGPVAVDDAVLVHAGVAIGHLRVVA